jgi:hypothetical protein
MTYETIRKHLCLYAARTLRQHGAGRQGVWVDPTTICKRVHRGLPACRAGVGDEAPVAPDAAIWPNRIAEKQEPAHDGKNGSKKQMEKELSKRPPAYWKNQSVRARAEAELMQNSLAKAGMLRVAATYATFERRALLRQATAKPPDEADVVVDRIAAGLAFQIAFTSQPEVAVLAVTGSRFGYE